MNDDNLYEMVAFEGVLFATDMTFEVIDHVPSKD